MSAWLGRVAGWLEARPRMALLLLVALYVPCVLRASRQTPLTHDELFTAYISGAPTMQALWADLRGFDLNPPLSYLFTRLTVRLDGGGALGLRLPEMAAFLVFLLAIVRFVQMRLGVVYGVFAATVLMGSVVWELAYLARPYALMLGFLGLALVAWQAAAEPGTDSFPRRRAVAVAVLGLAVAGMLLSHIFAVLGVVALAGGELWRVRQRHRLSWERGLKPGSGVDLPVFLDLPVALNLPVALALVLPLLLPVLLIAAYAPMLRSHGASLFPPAFQPDGNTVFEFYLGSIARELVELGLTGLLVLLLLGPKHLRGGSGLEDGLPVQGQAGRFTQASRTVQAGRTVQASRAAQASRTAGGWFFSPPEWCAALLLVGLPLPLMGTLMVTHGAFFARYGASASLGVALLTTTLLARWTLWQGRPDPRAALLGIVVVLAISGLLFAWPAALREGVLWPDRAHSEPGMLPCQSCRRTASLDPALPLVAASGLTFVQMTHYEPDSITRRLFYLTDAAGSRAYAHATIFERMGELVEHFHLRGRVEAYPEFLREHAHFFVLGRYDYPEDWLLRKLVANGADVQVLGHVEDSYRDTELYEVTITPPKAGRDGDPAQSRTALAGQGTQ